MKKYLINIIANGHSKNVVLRKNYLYMKNNLYIPYEIANVKNIKIIK